MLFVFTTRRFLSNYMIMMTFELYRVVSCLRRALQVDPIRTRVLLGEQILVQTRKIDFNVRD